MSRFLTPPEWDAVVVGGGPGGLTAALYLARFRRRVLVIDDGHSRALKIPRSHNLPGYPDGVPGTELVAAIRAQAERHGVAFAAGRVSAQTRDGAGFRIDWGDGQHTSGRVLVLATGTSDTPPPMAHLVDAVNTGAIRYCPVCDGYEVIDQAVGVLADGEAGAQEALYLRNFTNRLTLFPVHAAVRLAAATRSRLNEAGIQLIREPVRSIRCWNGKITVTHGESESHCDSLYSALGMKIHTELAYAAERNKAGYFVTDRHQRTSVPGLYAVGDVAQGLNQISVAMGGGAIAAAAIHIALGKNW